MSARARVCLCVCACVRAPVCESINQSTKMYVRSIKTSIQIIACSQRQMHTGYAIHMGPEGWDGEEVDERGGGMGDMGGMGVGWVGSGVGGGVGWEGGFGERMGEWRVEGWGGRERLGDG